MAYARRRSRARSRFERPIFIVAAPHPGASLLFGSLSRSPSTWTIGDQSDRVIEAIPELNPANRGWDSNRLGSQDAWVPVVERLEAGLLGQLRDRDGGVPGGEATALRLLDASPKNSLRVPFLNAAFPDALFIYLHREPDESLASMIAAWESGSFATYPDLPGWKGPPWSLTLTPEWRKLNGAQLPEIAAEQWRMVSEILLNDLEKLPPERWAVAGYENLIVDSQSEIERLCEFVDIDWDHQHTLTPARQETSNHHGAGLDPLPAGMADIAKRSRDLLARPPASLTRIEDGLGEARSRFRSVNTGNIAQILSELGSTLLVSTYQTGRLVAVREDNGGLNTHFRTLESPMGISHHDGRLAVGTKSQVWEYENVPALTQKLSPPGRHDACFVPRKVSYTGDIRIHDVAWAEGELWLVATRFSCLATLDGRHSFVPRWRPPFISALAAEDRCHLNGMAVVDGEVRYVTALGATDTAGGWREHKASGGVLIDVESGQTAIAGLSMPHSPRWHRDRLWILESGQGTLATVDLDAGTVQTVTELPGFTRGLAFAGPLAFIGLSEVREATTFGGLPLTARLEERQCGVWVVNIDTGQTVGFLRFEDLVEEIFDVGLLRGIRFPEIAEHGSQAVNDTFVVPDEALEGGSQLN